MSNGCNPKCKICDGTVHLKFSLPKSKKTGHPIPDLPDDAPYYECYDCGFLFTDVQDSCVITEIYDDDYWNNQDPDWYGRVAETLRLVLIANELLCKHADEIDILDFGCGAGAFVEIGRNNLSMNIWGTDINPPKVGKQWFLPDLKEQQFDMIVACEVIEHLVDPVKIFEIMRTHLKSPGVIAFQTAYWDGSVLGRDWWYLGPDNGHISLFSSQSLDVLANKIGVSDRRRWRNYPGLQAWRID